MSEISCCGQMFSVVVKTFHVTSEDLCKLQVLVLVPAFCFLLMQILGGNGYDSTFYCSQGDLYCSQFLDFGEGTSGIFSLSWKIGERQKEREKDRREERKERQQERNKKERSWCTCMKCCALGSLLIISIEEKYYFYASHLPQLCY